MCRKGTAWEQAAASARPRSQDGGQVPAPWPAGWVGRGGFIPRGDNLLPVGQPGTGKTHLAAEPAPLAEPVVSPKGKPLDWWAHPEARPQGRSTMHKWSCGCQSVRVGTKEFHAQCLRCGNLFARTEAPAHQDTGAPHPQTHPDPVPTSDSGWRQGEIVREVSPELPIVPIWQCATNMAQAKQE